VILSSSYKEDPPIVTAQDILVGRDFWNSLSSNPICVVPAVSNRHQLSPTTCLMDPLHWVDISYVPAGNHNPHGIQFFWSENHINLSSSSLVSKSSCPPLNIVNVFHYTACHQTNYVQRRINQHMPDNGSFLYHLWLDIAYIKPKAVVRLMDEGHIVGLTLFHRIDNSLDGGAVLQLVRCPHPSRGLSLWYLPTRSAMGRDP